MLTSAFQWLLPKQSRIAKMLRDLFTYQLLVLIQTHSQDVSVQSGLVSKKLKQSIQMSQSFVQPIS